MPVCSHLRPTILDGRLCFSVNIPGLLTESGDKAGLQILLDPVPATPDPGFKLSQETTLHDQILTRRSMMDNQAEVNIMTLTRYRKRGSGVLAMTALKEMAGTDKFLEMDDMVKGCSLRSLEACQTQGFLEQVVADCSCLPWTLVPALGNQVIPFTSTIN